MKSYVRKVSVLRGLILVSLVLPVLLYSTEYSLSRVREEFVGSGPHELSPYIINGSEEVSVNGVLLPRDDYSIDYDSGTVCFNIPLSRHDTVSCVYKRLPFDLPRQYCHRKLSQNTEPRTEKAKEEGSTSKTEDTESGFRYPEPNRLSLMGTKTFGISLGSRQDMSFDQSMHLTMNGRLSEEMKIEGTLRDDGVPIEPEGTTQQLKDIDRIYVNVSTKNHGVRLGDFDFNASRGKFGKLDRKLEGILANSRIEGIGSEVQVGGALSKGRWTRKEFTGATGKQGPYELSPQGVVVAGSERVWVNGETMTRGNDYTVEYSAGSLTFTAKLPIDDGDRIVVEFQQKDESYRRTAVIGTHKSDDFEVLLFREDDMKDHPLSFSATPERVRSLSETDSSFAWISGANHVGQRKGAYVKRDSIYEYVGYGNGDFEVSFTRVSEGDYEFDAILGGYRHIGNGNGNYTARIRVPLPQSSSLVDAKYEKELSRVKFSIEGGATKFEQNTFARSNGIGKAIAGQVETGSSRWLLGASFRNLDSSFHFPGTPDTLEPKRGDVFLGLTPASFLHTDARVAKTADDLKKELGVKLTPDRLPNLSYRCLLSDKRTVNQFGGSYRIIVLEPFFGYEITDQKESQDTSRTNIGEVGIRSRWFNLGVKEKKRNSGFDSHTRTSTISVMTMPLTLSYAYKQRLDDPGTPPVDLGNLKFAAKGFSVAYDLTSLERKAFEEEHYRVAPGNGSFSRDSVTGRYYPDTHGDYEKRLVPADRSAIYKNFNLSHGVVFRVDENVLLRASAVKRGEGLDIRFWERTEEAVEDKNRISFGARAFDLYANYTREDHRVNRITGMLSSGDQTVLQVDFRPEPYDFTYTGRNTRNWEQHNPTWEERATTLGAGISTARSRSDSPESGFRTHFMIRGEQREIDEPPYSPVHFYGASAEPRLTYQLRDKIIETRFRVTDWFTGDEISPSTKTIYPPGISFNWGADFIVFSRSRTNYSINYQGMKTPDYPTDHTLNAQVSINF